jgi:hypothetical protein
MTAFHLFTKKSLGKEIELMALSPLGRQPKMDESKLLALRIGAGYNFRQEKIG